MRRREFIAVLGGAALARPFAVHAQPLATPVIGFLSSGTSEARAALTAAFRRGLAEIGYIEGQNVAIEFRWAQDRYETAGQPVSHITSTLRPASRSSRRLD